MNKINFATALLLISIASAHLAKADVFECISDGGGASYSTGDESLKVSDEMGKVTHVISKVSFHQKQTGVFELISADQSVLMTLTLDHQGTDGASDCVYPYTGKWNSEALAKYGIGKDDQYQGCNSDFVKATGCD